jgi:hypothetical protein
MSESVRPRFAVDLNEIEKQLSQQSQPAPTPPVRNDPLAELARIVGQDDPFQSLLAGDRRSRPAPEASLDDLFVSRDGVPAPKDPGLRSAFQPDDRADHDPYGQVGASYADYHAKVEAEGGYDPHFPLPFEDGEPDHDVHGAGGAPARPKSRKVMMTAGVIAAVAVLGVGGALMLNSPATMIAGGEPPLITATNEPSKVQPQSPGGVEIPNQNKQIYERGNRDTQTQVVNREEQPVDVRQAARAAAPTASVTPPAGNGLNLGEPRKVRTVSIRPDGTIISADAPTTVPTAPAALSLPPAAQAASTPSTTPVQPRTMPAVAPTAPAPATPAPRAVAATPAAPTTGGSSPQQAPSATPAAPAPQRIAAAQPVALAPTPAAPASASASDTASIGGFAVQLGVSPSEADARTTLQRLQQKFPDLGGATPLIRKAEVNGNTIYRVRVGPMTRDDASSLCSKVQGQGGQCFVAKN